MKQNPGFGRQELSMGIWRTTIPVAALIAIVVLVGCANVSGSEPTAPNATLPTSSAAPTPGAPSPTSTISSATASPGIRPTRIGSPQPTRSAEEAKMVDMARQDLAKRESVAVDQVKVVSVTSVQWPTTALGCPQPGIMYAQIVTPGYRIVLESKGQTYEYHSDRGRRVVYCPNP